MCVPCTESFTIDRLYKKHILDVHTKKEEKMEFNEEPEQVQEKKSGRVTRSSHTKEVEKNDSGQGS